MNNQSLEKAKLLLPAIRKLCNHNVAGMPLGSFCGGTIERLIKSALGGQQQ